MPDPETKCSKCGEPLLRVTEWCCPNHRPPVLVSNAKLLQLCRDLVEDAERAASPSARQYKYKELKAAIAEAEGKP